jgi:hypothetical protein
LYVEDFKRGANKDIGPKDIFEMGSTNQFLTCININYCQSSLHDTISSGWVLIINRKALQ